MTMLYLAGQSANFLTRGVVTVSPAADALYPLANLSDGDPSTPMVFGAASANPYVQLDLNLFSNSAFAGNITGWTGGTYTTAATTYRTAVGGLKLAANSTAYQDVTVRAGESVKISFWVRAFLGTEYGALRVKNLRTGLWLTSALGWGAEQNVVGSASSTWTEITATFAVESFDLVGANTCTLRVYLYAENTGTEVYFDDGWMAPGVSFVSIHGHNIAGEWTSGSQTPQVVTYSHDAFSTANDIAYFTKYRGAFFYAFALTYARYWQVFWSGTPLAALYLGEVVIGQYQSAVAAAQWGLSVESEIPGVRTSSPAGRVGSYNFATDATRGLVMEFEAYTAAAARELSEALWLRSGQGRHPTIIVPSHTETDVFYGHLSEPMAMSRPPGVYATVLRLHGAPLPTVGV